MRSLALGLAVLSGSILLVAAPSISGKWAAKSPVAVQMELNSSGATLTGVVRLSEEQAFTIVDGRVEGDRVTFRVILTEGEDHYPLLFTGRRSGNRIAFK